MLSRRNPEPDLSETRKSETKKSDSKRSDSKRTGQTKATVPKPLALAPAVKLDDVKPPLPLWATSFLILLFSVVTVVFVQLYGWSIAPNPWFIPMALAVMMGLQFVAVRINRGALKWDDPQRKERRAAREASLPTVAQWRALVLAVGANTSRTVATAGDLTEAFATAISERDTATAALAKLEAAVRGNSTDPRLEATSIAEATAADLSAAIALGEHLALKGEKPKNVTELKQVVDRLRPSLAVIRTTEGDPVRSHTMLGDIFDIFFGVGAHPALSRGKLKELAAEWKAGIAELARVKSQLIDQQERDLITKAATANLIIDRDSARDLLKQATTEHAAQVRTLQEQLTAAIAARQSAADQLEKASTERADALRSLASVTQQRDEVMRTSSARIEELSSSVTAATQARDEALARAEAAELELNRARSSLARVCEQRDELSARLETLSATADQLATLNDLDTGAMALEAVEAFNGVVGLIAYYMMYEQQRRDVRSKDLTEWLATPVFEALRARRDEALKSAGDLAKSIVIPSMLVTEELIGLLIRIVQKCVKTRDQADFVIVETSQQCPKEAREFLRSVVPEPAKVGVALRSAS